MTRKPFLIGLTGSIGMGKSTTAAMFRERGIPVWDADAAVGRLYSIGGAAVIPVGKEFPGAIVGGAVSKDILKQHIHANKSALSRLERIVHPLVRADRERFIRDSKAPVIVLDIPLLYEGDGAEAVDFVVVVSAPEELQRARVLERPGMTEAQLDLILSKQMPDAEKRTRADYVIPTQDLSSAEQAVDAVLKIVEDRIRDA